MGGRRRKEGTEMAVCVCVGLGVGVGRQSARSFLSHSQMCTLFTLPTTSAHIVCTAVCVPTRPHTTHQHHRPLPNRTSSQGVQMQPPAASRFQAAVLGGRWEEAAALLPGLTPAAEVVREAR